jgi:peroxiredoxin
MSIALLVGRLLLAAVFLVAGVAKLADRSGSRQGLIDFGVPGALAAPFGILLPLAELVVGAALIPTATAWWGAVGALALLLLFVLGIGVNLARGREPDCRCFGQLHSAPAGWKTLARNGALAAVAGFLVWEGRDGGVVGPSAVGWLGGLSTAQSLGLIGGLVLLGFLIAQWWFLAHLLRQNGRLLVRLEALEGRPAPGDAPPAPTENGAEPAAGLPVGSVAPSFALQGLYGETLTLDALRAPGKPVMLLFTDPNCGPCTALLPELGRWQQEHAAALAVSVISRGTPEENRAKSTEHGLTHVLLQQDWEVAETYKAAGTPSAVIVRPDGTIGSPLAAGPDAIRALVSQAVGAPSPSAPAAASAPAHTGDQGDCPNCGNGSGAAQSVPVAPKIGEPAAPLKLPDLSAKTVDLSSFLGSKTLVLFWSPGCSSCVELLDDLKRWETERPSGVKKILVVSIGTVEANEDMGLRSPVVLDQGGKTMRRFGVYGTPSAVLVDGRGKIASELAVSAPAIRLLVGEAPRGRSKPVPIPSAPKIGEPAPPIKLPDLGGKTVNLAGFRGKETLVLFWNPGCGFCQRMLPDLKEWEQNRPQGAPKLLVVSAGTAEENKEMGLHSPVVLDQGFSVGSAFGAGGTPSAVLVDRKGRVASELAVGAPAVLELARAGRVT